MAGETQGDHRSRGRRAVGAVGAAILIHRLCLPRPYESLAKSAGAASTNSNSTVFERRPPAITVMEVRAPSVVSGIAYAENAQHSPALPTPQRPQTFPAVPAETIRLSTLPLCGPTDSFTFQDGSYGVVRAAFNWSAVSAVSLSRTLGSVHGSA